MYSKSYETIDGTVYVRVDQRVARRLYDHAGAPVAFVHSSLTRGEWRIQHHCDRTYGERADASTTFDNRVTEALRDMSTSDTLEYYVPASYLR